MRSILLLLALAALVVPAAASADGPQLRAAHAVGGHVEVVFSLGGLVRASQIQIAAGPNGRFTAGAVRLSERIAAAPNAATGLVRWRTHGVLRPGRYWVRVSAVDAGETSCTPKLSDCLAQWSNVLPVTVT
jgi:hypothetical protein